MNLLSLLKTDKKTLNTDLEKIKRSNVIDSCFKELEIAIKENKRIKIDQVPHVY